MCVHAVCVLDAGNHFPASESSQDSPTELYFEVGHSINKIKFSWTVLEPSWCWKMVSSIKNACSIDTHYSMLKAFNIFKNSSPGKPRHFRIISVHVAISVLLLKNDQFCSIPTLKYSSPVHWFCEEMQLIILISRNRSNWVTGALKYFFDKADTLNFCSKMLNCSENYILVSPGACFL